MPDPLLSLPLAQIDAEALPRDRSTSDPAAFAELWHSILRHGLRQPIEVFATERPLPYALISGHRRLMAFRHLHEGMELPAFANIPAFLRTPESIPAALTAMIEENEVRADLPPWDKGRILVECVSRALFPTLDAAVSALHPTATRQKRARLRACATVVEELEGQITTPERLNENRLLRLASALRGTFVDVIHQILTETRGQSLESQWAALLQTLIEADRGEEDFPETPTTPARPRRMLTLPQGLIIRRELSPGGYLLRFSGPEARKGGLMEDVMDMVERNFVPKG